ncbi:hypothetical protein PLESTB_001985700 [Pleodorina starrii]|uniref:Uncharacterized protein n=1 Tax=Pleodorina starrii TaxID=330485 RepID=A0A9W6C3W6_9CHLO|nr:hypothetical protein PLESTB_001985700 [Pleodorina starrii]
MWPYESLWGYAIRLMAKQDTPEITCMFSWHHMQAAFLAGEEVEGSIVFPEVLPLSSSAQPGLPGSVAFELRNYWTSNSSTPPTIHPKAMGGDAGYKKVTDFSHKTLYEVHLMYTASDPTYATMFGLFMTWLWEQWSTNTQVTDLVGDGLEELQLSHKRADLLRRSGSAIEFKDTAFAAFCIRELWPNFNYWVGSAHASTSTDWRRRYTLDLPARFLEQLKGMSLNESVHLVPWRQSGPEVQRDTWFITRKCPASEQMWAGKVLGIYWLLSPCRSEDGEPRVDVVLDVEWHSPCLDRSGNPIIDESMNVPLVHRQVADVPTRYYLAADVAAVRVDVLPHPTVVNVLCVLSRSFSFMRVAGWAPLRPLTQAGSKL